jgi:transketolase
VAKVPCITAFAPVTCLSCSVLFSASYENEQVFSAGKGHVVRSHEQDDLVIVGAGVTLHEALKASDMLMEAGIKAAVIDPFTIKPIDHDLLLKEATRCNGRVLTVEDHYPEGGLVRLLLQF